MTTIRRFYNKYRTFLELNKNLMFSGTAAFFVSAAVTELYSIPANIKSCNYEDVLTGRVHVFEFTNLC
jgi:hypothetical protein